jgi:hypothetical protein
MRLRTLLVLTGIALPAAAQQQDFLRQGPVFTPRELLELQQRLGKPQAGVASTERPLTTCSVPLTNLTPAAPVPRMPTITPNEKTKYSMKYLAPPAPACEPNERREKSKDRR